MYLSNSMISLLSSLLQVNGGLPVDHQEHIKKQLSTLTLRSARSAQTLCRSCTTGVCRVSGWGPYPPENSRTDVDCSLTWSFLLPRMHMVR
jgi:hypothetical protein